MAWTYNMLSKIWKCAYMKSETWIETSRVVSHSGNQACNICLRLRYNAYMLIYVCHTAIKIKNIWNQNLWYISHVCGGELVNINTSWKVDIYSWSWNVISNIDMKSALTPPNFTKILNICINYNFLWKLHVLTSCNFGEINKYTGQNF